MMMVNEMRVVCGDWGVRRMLKGWVWGRDEDEERGRVEEGA